MNEPKLYELKDICRIFGITPATVFRWLRESRAGKNPFPLPLDTGGRKRKLLWNAANIEAFCQTPNSLFHASHVEPATSQEKRHRVAVASLAEQGVKFTGLPKLLTEAKR